MKLLLQHWCCKYSSHSFRYFTPIDNFAAHFLQCWHRGFVCMYFAIRILGNHSGVIFCWLPHLFSWLNIKIRCNKAGRSALDGILVQKNRFQAVSGEFYLWLLLGCCYVVLNERRGVNPSVTGTTRVRHGCCIDPNQRQAKSMKNAQ